MFGCEAVIRDQNAGIGADGDVTEEVPVCMCRAPANPASMQMKDYSSRLEIAGSAPPSRDRAYGIGLEAHVLGLRNVLHDRVEWSTNSTTTRKGRPRIAGIRAA
jgi:hypothetical protein